EIDMSAGEYLKQKLISRPYKFMDTGIYGLTGYSFWNKWKGYEYLLQGLGFWLAALSMIGLLFWLFHHERRLSLVLLFASLIPYVFTWEIPGGAEWRYTMHAYPIYLLAAGYFLQELLARFFERSFWLRGVIAIVLLLCGWMFLDGLNFLRKNEALKHGERVMIAAGGRGFFFYGRGWLRPSDDTGAQVRYASQPTAVIRLSIWEPSVILLSLRPLYQLTPQVQMQWEGKPMSVTPSSGGDILSASVPQEWITQKPS